MTDEEFRELIRQLDQAIRLYEDVFTDEGLGQTQCGRTVAIGHSIGVSTVWFGSAGESSSNAQELANNRAFEHCLRRCGSLACPAGMKCVFDTEANEGFSRRCRFFTIYLGVHKRFFISWHVSLSFAKCPCVCKCT